MGNKRDTKKTGSPTPKGNQPDRAFEGQGPNPGKGIGSPGKKTSESHADIDDDMTTSGGRQGKFSDSESPGGDQWSPGSNQESDR